MDCRVKPGNDADRRSKSRLHAARRYPDTARRCRVFALPAIKQTYAPPHLRARQSSAIVEVGSGGLAYWEYQMRYRSFALAVAAFLAMSIASAAAQSVYVAPGGVYIGAGPVYVTPAPNLPAPYVAPTYGYGPPAVVAPAPAVVAPPVVYGPNGGYSTRRSRPTPPSCRRDRLRRFPIRTETVASPATITAATGNPATKRRIG